MAYTFDQIFAADPANTLNVARNASITIFAPGDATMTPVTLTTVDGQPYANPITTNANGFAPKPVHETLDQLDWAGGGFTGSMYAYAGIKDEAVAARAAADTAAADASSSAASSAASAALVGAPADTAVETLVNATGSATRGALNATYVGKPTTPEQTFFVTPRGNDANDGLTLMSAKATIGAAITAAGANRPRIILGAGIIPLASEILYPYGTTIAGPGSGITSVVYSGSGTAFSPATPGVRTYYPSFEGFALEGPGKATATIGISLDSVTDSSFKDVVVRLFGTGIRVHSAINGGAVYNHLDHVTASTCGTGFKIDPAGSNATKFIGCRANACDIGLDITDSNNTNWVAGAFEANTTGIRVTASVNAASDQNIVAFARFESNTTAWNVTSTNVRDFQILYPSLFGTYTVVDLGTRTAHWGNTYTIPNKTSSAIQSSAGAWRYERTTNGGSELPAMVISDSVTNTGTPVTLQLETERAAGYFLRGTRGGVTYFDVDASGNMRFPQGGSLSFGGSPIPQSADVQAFTADGTWTMPSGAKTVEVVIVGGGGGGGSGRRGAAASVRCGGGGGAGGAVTRIQLPASSLTSPVAVTVGLGGAGGASATADDTSGNNGVAGTSSVFGSYARANGGAQGTGGTATAGTGGGTQANGMFASGAGASASATGLLGPNGAGSAAAAAGGGAGGGITTGDAASAGGAGGGVFSYVPTGTGTGGAVGTAGTAGTAGPASSGIPGQGSGGGGSSTSAAAGAGANGALYGGGGGGGGASLNGFASGAGGNGANGIVIVTSTF